MAALDWLLPDQVSSVAWFLLVGSAAAMLIAMAKAGFGGSIGLLSTPMMIMACDGQASLALGIMLPLLIACDYISIIYWRGQWELKRIRILVPGMIIGIVIGSVVLWRFGRIDGAGGMKHANATMGLAIGLIALGFATVQWLRSRRGELKVFRPTTGHGLIAGTAAGVTSTLAHAAGPIVTMYLLPQQMPKNRYVATTVVYYWIGNQLKVPTYLLLGQLDTEAMLAAAVLIPAVVAGTLLGFFLHHRVNQKSFTVVVYVLLGLMGVHLTYTSVLKLWPLGP